MSVDIESILCDSFKKIKIQDDIMDEYDILLQNIEMLKNNKCYTKSFAKKLHQKNLQYKKDIIFQTGDDEQIKIKNQIRKCLEFNPSIDNVLYCLKTKKLLNTILNFLKN